MRRSVMLLVLGMIAGCSPAKRSGVSLELRSDLARGNATLTCHASTSGACHVVFITGGTNTTAQAAVGATVTTGGLAAGTRFCGDLAPPDPQTCKSIALSDAGIQRMSRNTSISD